jgi:hypothetical protein
MGSHSPKETPSTRFAATWSPSLFTAYEGDALRPGARRGTALPLWSPAGEKRHYSARETLGDLRGRMTS